MLHFGERDLSVVIDAGRVYHGEGRGETGVCLHLPFKGHVAGAIPAEDYLIMLSVANNLIDFLLYKRVMRGAELWDYDADQASESYTVCGDNPNSSGITLRDKSYTGGPKLQLFLDKTFGANEVSVRWKNALVGDERLLGDYGEYLKQTLRGEGPAVEGD